MSANSDFDILLIGAGSAGLSVASGASQLGLSVALFEAGEMGGDCLNAGCVPSKALLSYAKAKHQVEQGAALLDIQLPKIEADVYAKAMAHVRQSIAAIAPHDSQERFEGLGTTVIRARAKLVGPNMVQADGRDFTGKLIVIATGASPFVPPIPGLDQVAYETNETIFHRTSRPEHLIVVGGGPIGCEMAQAHARLGSQVTLVEMGQLMPHDDPEAVEVVRHSLVKDGITLLESHQVQSVRQDGEQSVVSCKNGDDEIVEVRGSDILMAVGRKPNIDGIGLAEIGVQTNRQGIVVDKRLRSSVKSIYALGDVAGGAQFTHMAGAHASAFVRGALFRAGVDMSAVKVPWVTYCDPELAQFGMTEAKAQESGHLANVYRVDLAQLDRQVTEGDEIGFGKIMLDKTNNVLGVTIVGKGAGDLLTPWLVADAGGVKLSAIASMIVPYPTRGEVTKRMASLAFVERLFAASTKRLVRFLFGLPRF